MTLTATSAALARPLSPEARANRLAVAREVVEIVRTGRFGVEYGMGYFQVRPAGIPTSDVYLRIQDAIRTTWDSEVQLIPFLESIGTDVRCVGCLLGAFLVAKARTLDAVPAKDVFYPTLQQGRRGSLIDLMGDVFEPAECLVIESTFEGCTSHSIALYDHHENRNRPDSLLAIARGAALFGRQFPSAVTRALAVAEKIVADDGELLFEPATEEEYLDAVGGPADEDEGIDDDEVPEDEDDDIEDDDDLEDDDDVDDDDDFTDEDEDDDLEDDDEDEFDDDDDLENDDDLEDDDDDFTDEDEDHPGEIAESEDESTPHPPDPAA
jgi:hypothetical protein